MSPLSWVRPHCVSDPFLLLAILLGNGWIAWSYLRIPRTLRRIIRRLSGEVTGGGEVKATARFVAACAGTHLFAMATLFLPAVDRIAVVWMFYTGAISAVTDRMLRQREEQIVQAVLGVRELTARVDA